MRRAHLGFAWLLLPFLGCASEDIVVRPTTGGAAGGTRVRIAAGGVGDRGPVMVYFGDVPARGLTIADHGLLRAVVPPGQPETDVDVEVRFADGTRLEAPGAFHYTGLITQPSDD